MRFLSRRLVPFLSVTFSAFRSGKILIYQGVVIDLERKAFRISTAMQDKIRGFCAHSQGPGGESLYQVCALEKLVGRLEWCAWLVPGARQHVYYLIKVLQAARDTNSLLTQLTEEARSEISWWKQDSTLRPGRSFENCDRSVAVEFSAPEVVGSSDATPARYGFRLFSHKFRSFLHAKSGLVKPINSLLNAHGKPNIKMDTSKPNQIGYAELYAVFRAVQEAPNGSRLLLKVDNKGVVGGLLKGRFRNEEMNALLGLILDELMKNTKFIQSQWVDTHEMEKLGSDDLSRGRFRPEGYTVAPQMFAKVQRICTETFGVFESKIILDAFGSPSQNPFNLPYLSRIVDENDPLCLGSDFFQYNFNAYKRDGVIYAFPPRKIELTIIRHLCGFLPQRWIIILSGENLPMATQLVQGKYEYNFERFAVKAHKRALMYNRSPAYMLMALALRPKQSKRPHSGL